MIAVGLAAALACHPYATLLAIPFGAGEIARAIERRKIDWPVWLAFAAAIPITVFYPALLASMRDIDLRGLQPGIGGLPGFYADLFKSAIAPLLAAGAAAYLVSRGADTQAAASWPRVFPRYESVALAGFILAPAVLILVVVISKNLLFIARYGLIAVIGMSGFAALLLFRAAGGRERTGIVVAAVLIAWLMVARGKEARAEGTGDPRSKFEQERALIVKAAKEGKPVVLAGTHAFFESDFYLSEEAARRCYYVLLDRDFRRKYAWQDMSDRQVELLSRHLSLKAHVQPLTDFVNRNAEFLLHADNDLQALCDLLVERGWQLTLLAHRPGESLFLARAAQMH
jgi:hypothetical protein